MNVSIPALLKKTEHYDKDERYMATSDLCEVLKRHSPNNNNTNSNDATTAPLSSNTPVLDAATERHICTAVLRLLHDKSNDVQAIAVKTLGVLLSTVQQEQVLEIADSLADQVLDVSKSELRDVYAIGLRTLVKTIPAAMGDRVAQRLVGRLLDGIRTSSSNDGSGGGDEIVLSCLDVLTELLGRFGGTAVSVARQHEAILHMCLTQLATTEPYHANVRKRTGNALAGLSQVLNDALLQRMVQALLQQVPETPTAPSNSMGQEGGPDVRALIRTLCAVSAAVGHRLGPEQIDRLVPLFLRFCHPAQAVTGDDDDEEEEDGATPMDTEEDDPNWQSWFGSTTTTSYSSTDDEEAAVQWANELRESCLLGLESFVLQCPLDALEKHWTPLVRAALAYMSYDPNYAYGPEEDDENKADEEDPQVDDDEEDDMDDYDEEDEEDDEDDDDDESWKVRRGAVRVLKAIVEAKKHVPGPLWQTSYKIRRGKSSTVAWALVSRFREREENCRVGVIDCYARLLDVTIAAQQQTTTSSSSSSSSSAVTAGGVDSTPAAIVQFQPPTDGAMSTDEVVDFRKVYATRLVQACTKILGTKKGNERSKSSALALLATLCKAPGGVGQETQIQTVFTQVETFLAPPAKANQESTTNSTTTSKALRLDALSLVHTLLASDKHNPSHVRLCLYQSLLAPLCESVKEQWYKVIAEALRALAVVPYFFVVGYADQTAAEIPQERAAVAQQVYTAVEPLLAAHDVDQEIKECALKAAATLLSGLHANLTSEAKERMLRLLLERLKNETTRIAALKNLSSIAAPRGITATTTEDAMVTEDASTLVDLSPILADSIATMSSFLKLQSRSLKQSTLETLEIIVLNHGKHADFADGKLFSSVVQDLAPLVVDSDLHLSHLSLQCCVSILQVCPAAGSAVQQYVLHPALALSTSVLLQDSALDSLLAFFKQVVVSQAIQFDELLTLLRERLDDKVGKHGIYNLAKCIAIITHSSTPENMQKVLSDVFSVLESAATAAEATNVRQIQLSLLITGDLGRMTDLSADGSAERLKTIYLQYFDSAPASEDLKHAAAYALGNAAVGSPTTFIPAIVSKLDDENATKQQYLLLTALREFIKCSARLGKSKESLVVADLVVPLEKHCSDQEEGVRTMVAECFGSLTVLHPEPMLEKLKELQTSHSAIDAPEGTVPDGDETSKKNALVCWTVATSVKLAIAGKVDATQLSSYMPTFVSLLHQKELSVRTAALLLVYSATHHMPQVVAGLMQDPILKVLYEVSALKLQRKVDLGPFTHTVDDAIPLRKAALSIFATCLESLPGSLDMAKFMDVLAHALGDAQEDIQLHAHQMVISMCARRQQQQQPSYLITAAENFVEPLEKTLKKKPGQKTGTELERLNDWIKSALRVALALGKVEGLLQSSRRFAEFLERVRGDAKFTSMIQALEAER